MRPATATALFLLGATATAASAQTYTWTGGGADELWSTPGNWEDGVVPGAWSGQS